VEIIPFFLILENNASGIKGYGNLKRRLPQEDFWQKRHYSKGCCVKFRSSRKKKNNLVAQVILISLINIVP
jgi:hypothetical protein